MSGSRRAASSIAHGDLSDAISSRQGACGVQRPEVAKRRNRPARHHGHPKQVRADSCSQLRKRDRPNPARMPCHSRSERELPATSRPSSKHSKAIGN